MIDVRQCAELVQAVPSQWISGSLLTEEGRGPSSDLRRRAILESALLSALIPVPDS